MQVDSEILGEINIVTPSGRLDSMTAPHFESELLTRTEQSTNGVIVDFTNLEYVSSAGLRILLMAAKRMKAASRKLILCGLSDSIHDVFRISGFLTIFTIVDSREEAIEKAKE